MAADLSAVTGRLPALPTPGSVVVRGVPGGARSVATCCRRGRAAAGRANPHRPQADLPHGTTIVALGLSTGGVVMAGDRRATMGNLIAQRDIEKVFPRRRVSCVGIAGTAGLAVELVRLFQVELEHYEKIEGTLLSLDGKANRLSIDAPRQPRAGHAGPRGGAAVRRLRPRDSAPGGSSATT